MLTCCLLLAAGSSRLSGLEARWLDLTPDETTSGEQEGGKETSQSAAEVTEASACRSMRHSELAILTQLGRHPRAMQTCSTVIFWDFLLKAQPICVLQSGVRRPKQEPKAGYTSILLCGLGLLVFMSEGYDKD